MSRRSFPILLLIGVALTAVSAVASPHPSYSKDVPIDTVPFYDHGVYDPDVPKPNDHFSNPVGVWPARYGEITAYLETLAAGSPRMMLADHGQSFDGNRLIHLIISSPENLSRLDELVSTMDRVADPRQVSGSAELDNLIADLPAFAWLGYSIHGDEVSGSDAAVQLAYHLAAAVDSATSHLLDNLVIVIDPSENPDGRERYLTMLQTYRSAVPNYDSRAMQHRGVWPWGRSNHYWFDLNRDWILHTQPETIGRAGVILKYHPVLVVDAHEMGSNATFLFSPPRQPINYNTPDNVMKWYDRFRDDQAAAFDQRGWPYYTGEWNDQWYVGYGSAWPTLFGTVGILYEQAGVDAGSVLQRDGYLLTYHEAINHQFTSSLANITTAANNRAQLLRDYHDARAKIIAEGRESNLSYVFPPHPDRATLNRFIRSLISQGIEVQMTSEPFTVGSATDAFGDTHSSKQFPAGTYLVSTAQPHGALANAVLEFDTHLKKEFLEEERRELEKYGDTRMYEASTWSVPLAYDLDAYTTTGTIGVPYVTVTDPEDPSGQLVYPDARFGFIADMEGEITYRLLVKLFDNGLSVHASEKAFKLEGREYQSGALMLRRRGNPDNLSDILSGLAAEIGINIYGVNTGLSTEGSHLGAPTFRILTQPRVALLVGRPMDYTSSGSLWFTIDRELNIPHSLIDLDMILYGDISEYNVLVLPSSWGNALGHSLGKRGAGVIQEWVEDGGTLILIGSSAVWAADTATGLSQVRLMRQVLGDLDKYKRMLEREISAESPTVDTMALWHPDKVPAGEETAEEKPPAAPPKAAKELDEWQRRFFPRGVILQSNVDTTEWLAFGLDERLPVMLYGSYVFLSAEPVTTVARLSPDENDLRISGLLWPEARSRWAGSAYLTRETRGKGQIIMFANQPYVRAFARGTWRPFVTALLYGPGHTRSNSPYEQ